MPPGCPFAAIALELFAVIPNAFRLPLTSALVGLALTAQAAPAAPTPITFDTTPRAGQHQRQKVDMQATVVMRAEAGPDATDAQRAQIAQGAERMAQMGPMKMSMQMQQTMQVGQPDADGWLPLTVGTHSKTGQVTVGGKTVPLPQPQPPNSDLSFTARFNPTDFNFEIQKVEGSPAMSAMLASQGSAMVKEALQLSQALRNRPMAVGDSVDVPLNMPLPVPLPGGAGQMDGQVHYTLARVERGVAYFDLTMDMKMDINAPAPQPATPASDAASAAGEAASAPAAAAPGQVMRIAINGRGTGTSSLRLADRLPLNSQMAMDMQMTMNMPDNGLMHMDMAVAMSSKGESLAPAAPAKAVPKKKS